MSANASLNERTELRVAIYARVSTDKQDNGNQLIQLREFCHRQQWEIVNEFCDTISGSGKRDRVNFERMMLAASQKQFDMLVFWSLDRLSREGIVKTLSYLAAPCVGHRLEKLYAAVPRHRQRDDQWHRAVRARGGREARKNNDQRAHEGWVTAHDGQEKSRSACCLRRFGKGRKLRRGGLGLRAIAERLGVCVNSIQRVRGKSDRNRVENKA